MTVPSLLTQEVLNRFRALPPEQKRDVCLALVRIAVQVTADFMRECPEAVEDYLRLHHSGSVH
jgi:hypothetical protein